MVVRQRKRLGEILLDWGVITEENVSEAMEYMETENSRFGEALISLGFANEDDVTKALAIQYNMEYIDPEQITLDELEMEAVPKDIITRHQIIPLARGSRGRLRIVITDPFNLQVMDTLRFMLNDEDPIAYLAPKGKVKAFIDEYIDSNISLEKEMASIQEDSDKMLEGIKEDKNVRVEEGEATEDSAPVIRLVKMLIAEAVRLRASDIHVEPMADRVRIRYRVDGICAERDNIPKQMQGAVINRLKIMAKMNLAEKRIPLDGRIKMIIDNETVDFRVSTVPTNNGESMVLRILRTESAKLNMRDLGFGQDDYNIFQDLIKKPNGIILVTGPTGSGKTTTLYAALNELNRPDRKIITAEDPIEYNFAGINQCQVNTQTGLTFTRILRSMLRQAPNIILVGEIRDFEVAEVAIQASLTGHLVFSTLHTNDAPSALPRLINMGVKPFLAASSIQAVMAQRLTRTICSHCKEEDPKPDPSLLKLLDYTDDELNNATFFKGKGCDNCNHTGYRGRQGIFELMVMNNSLRELTFNVAPTNELRKAALATGMKSLLEDGKDKIQAGITTLEEVARLTQSEENV